MCIVTPALQKVACQTVMTVEQRTEEANWFRKIGTTTAFTSLQKKTMLQILLGFHFVCVPVNSLELSFAVRERPRQNERFLNVIIPGK